MLVLVLTIKVTRREKGNSRESGFKFAFCRLYQSGCGCGEVFRGNYEGNRIKYGELSDKGGR